MIIMDIEEEVVMVKDNMVIMIIISMMDTIIIIEEDSETKIMIFLTCIINKFEISIFITKLFF